LLPRSPSMGCARACSAAYRLEDEASAFVASRVCIVQALEAGDREMPEGVHWGLARQMKEATMTTKVVALVLLCLMTGTAMAQQAKVTSLMSKDLTENPGKQVLMITVEYPPGASDPIHRHNAQAFVYVLEAPL
jgi:hypothetical protein